VSGLALPFVTAAVTDKLVDFATNLIGDAGYAGVFVLMTLESALIPIPSEATMLFAGFKVEDGTLTLFGIVAAGVLGNLVGSWIAYAIGYYGRLEMLDRYKVFHVRQEQLDQADRWFARWGGWLVLIGKMVPVVRTFVSLPAGVARMPIWRFTALAAIGSTIWITALTLAGRATRDHWTDWKDRLHYVDYAAAALIVLAVVYLGQRWWRARRARVAAADAA
jgi:membrane protein DedA with SNARE-associated domain